jgi:dTDP-4-dehydrorhamnose 3,5-epimerase
MSISLRRGILRGLHFQRGHAAEVKLVRVAQGCILDVIVDLRRESPTFGDHFLAELSAVNGKMMYVPRGFAHGFLALENLSQVCYQVSAPYAPEWEGGVRWNDPKLAIPWPIEVPELSPRDASHPDFDPDTCAF